MDFEKFDKGDDPHDILVRYMTGKYSKVNQTNVSAHGRDMWDGRSWNSLSWGAPSSMVSTKFYDKTMELSSVKDKPYIRYAWMRAGLVDDFVTLTRHTKEKGEYKPRIWRVEFSIRSSARGWFQLEDFNTRKKTGLWKEHTLDTYTTRNDLLIAFASLARQYFHFKLVERNKNGDLLRKDLCRDKVLFDFTNEVSECYTIDRLMSAKPQNKRATALEKQLFLFRDTHSDPAIYKACNLLLETLKSESIRDAIEAPFEQTFYQSLRQLLAYRTRYDENLKGEQLNEIFDLFLGQGDSTF